jgi:hypothetical protein
MLVRFPGCVYKSEIEDFASVLCALFLSHTTPVAPSGGSAAETVPSLSTSWLAAYMPTSAQGVVVGHAVRGGVA